MFNGKDLSGWKVPDGDNGHWKVVDGVIDYDAQSEAKGDKDLWTEREFNDFELHVEWRIKKAPWVNPNVMYILPDGTTAHDITGKPLHLPLPDSDSGVFLRGSGPPAQHLVLAHWIRRDVRLRHGSPDVPRTAPAVTPRTQADNPVGEWNHFHVTVTGNSVTVLLNEKSVIAGAMIPDLPARGASRAAPRRKAGRRVE